MFERFTEGARHVVVLAQDEARSLSHNYIGTEHLLLGLLREEEGLAARVLGSLGIDVEEVRARVAQIVGRGDEVTSGQVPFTPRAKKVLELALREAVSMGHNYIGTEHVLLGLLREGEGVANRILDEFGADATKVRDAITRTLEGPRTTISARPGRGDAWVAGGSVDLSVRWEYRVELLTASESEPRQARLNSVGARGWELVSLLAVGDVVQAFLKRPIRISTPHDIEGRGRWTVGALGRPWSNETTQSLPLRIGYLLDAMGRAKSMAAESATRERIDALEELERRLETQLKAAAIAITGSDRPLPRPMKLETVLDMVTAQKENLIEAQDFERAAATRDLERHLRSVVDDAVETVREADAQPEAE